MIKNLFFNLINLNLSYNRIGMVNNNSLIGNYNLTENSFVRLAEGLKYFVFKIKKTFFRIIT